MWGSIPGSGRSPGEGNDNSLQYSCLENPLDGGAWWATVHRVPKSWMQLSVCAHTTVCVWWIIRPLLCLRKGFSAAFDPNRTLFAFPAITPRWSKPLLAAHLATDPARMLHSTVVGCHSPGQSHSELGRPCWWPSLATWLSSRAVPEIMWEPKWVQPRQPGVWKTAHHRHGEQAGVRGTGCPLEKAGVRDTAVSALSSLQNVPRQDSWVPWAAGFFNLINY